MVMGDPNQLQQCLINLIFNAAEAMPGGGRLVLKKASDETGHSMVISGDDLPHIFEPFFTTKQEGQGTGLGLATTYGIIENHHGTITVESRVGHGTTFTIKLPIDGRG